MPLHLMKLAVGAESIDDLAQWQTGRLRLQKAQGVKAPKLWHTTFQRPKRETELLDGGSLYWVIKGVILVRQRLIGFGEGHKDDGSACCLLGLDPQLIPVRPTPRRPFQGWRYLTADDAPRDLSAKAGADDIADMPPKLRKELAQLGLL
jgi:hypothetical protein